MRSNVGSKYPVITKEALLLAKDKRLTDLIKKDLDILFCGINPGLYTAAIGHHFGRPGNRFWPALFSSGITPTLISPYDEEELLTLGIGITNIISRPTNLVSEVTKEELEEGFIVLKKKLETFQPKWIAILGIQSYRILTNSKAKIGRQDNIGNTNVWLLPNPSGINAHYTPSVLTKVFSDFKQEVIGDY